MQSILHSVPYSKLVSAEDGVIAKAKRLHSIETAVQYGETIHNNKACIAQVYDDATKNNPVLFYAVISSQKTINKLGL